MKRCTLLAFSCFIILLLIQAVNAYTSDIEKEKQQEITLYWGDEATFRNYTIEAFSFAGEKADGNVRLKLYKDGALADERIMSSSGGETWNGNGDDEIWIDLTGFYIDPEKEAYVKLGVTLRGLPSLSIEISTDADSYYADRDILLVVKLKNEGSNSTPSGARAGDVKLNISSDLQVISGDTEKSYYEVKNGQEMPEIKLTLDAPSLMERTVFTINATCTGYDAKNLPYRWTASKEINVNSVIEISKTATGGYINADTGIPTPTETNEDEDYYRYINRGYREEQKSASEMYINDDALVNIQIKNHGDFPVNGININDTITGDFTLKSGQTSFEVDITPREQKSFYYTVAPKRVGTYTQPGMTANWSYDGKKYHLESESEIITVHGPVIELKKSADKTTAMKGETVKVTVTATNTGDRTCIVNISDETPAGTKVTGGNLSAIAVLKIRESISTSYEIIIDRDGSVTLPDATCKYEDIKQYRATARSNSLTINITAPPPAPTPAGFTPPAPAEEEVKPAPAKTEFELLEPVIAMQWPLWVDAVAGALIGAATVSLIKRKSGSGIKFNKTRMFLIFSALLLIIIVIYSISGFSTTKIGDITSNSAGFDNKTVRIRGTIDPDTPLFLTHGEYRLIDDTGSIWVLTNRGTPAKRTEIIVEGKVMSPYKSGSIRLEAVVVEEKRS